LPDAAMNVVDAIRAALTLMVAPRSGPAEARPSLRRIWTMPKHEAALKG